MPGDLVGDEDIDSSPTFELIVDGDEAEEVKLDVDESQVKLDSDCTSTETASAAEPMTVFANKRLRMSDEDADAADIAAASECSSSAVFVTGMSHL